MNQTTELSIQANLQGRTAFISHTMLLVEAIYVST